MQRVPRARHEAYSCDIQDCSGGHPEWHIKGDALEAMRGGTITTCDGVRHDIGKWDLLIAHPPCTYLSNVAGIHFSLEHTPAEKWFSDGKSSAGGGIFHAVFNGECG